jgi:tetratricopeptide (TPR) repeat protein
LETAHTDWLQAFAAQPDAGDRPAEFFGRHADLRNRQSVELLHEEVLRLLYADPSRAERLARAAWWLSDDLADPASRAIGLRAMGHVSYARSNNEEAIGFYDAALQIFSSLGSELDAGRTLISSLQSLIYLGRYEDAFARADQAGEIFRRRGDHLRLARLASNVGNIFYRQDRYQGALAKYEEAYATLSRLGEHRDVAAVLSNIAVCHVSLGRFEEALESYRSAREYSELHGLPLLVSGADYNIAYLYYLRGDFLRSIEAYKASRQRCREVGDAYHAALCDLDEAEVRLELNLNIEAAQLAKQAEAGFHTLGMAYERAKATATRAFAAGRLGETRLAGRLFQRARKLFEGEQNILWPALIDYYRAILLERENSDPAAGRLCRRAHPVLANSAFSGAATLVELLQSRLLLKAGDEQRARELCARASERLEGAGTPALRFQAHFMLARIEEHAGNRPAAFRAYEAARLEIETLRSRLWGDQPKVSFLKDKLAVYESLVSLRLADSDQPAASDAFRYIQQVKSRTLADLISQASPTPPAEQPTEQERQIEEARRGLNAQYRQMDRAALSPQAASAAQMEGLKRRIRECEGHLLRLSAAMPASVEEGAGTSSLSTEAIQASIPRSATLLEYYVVRGRLWVGLLDGSGLEMVPLGEFDAIRTRMMLLLFQLRKFGMAPNFRAAARQWKAEASATHLRELYDDLVAPVRSRLRKTEHLIFAPHDFLHRLPFHALRGPDGDLIDEFTVSYAPSATVFALCMGRPARFGKRSLVLAIPDENARYIGLEALTTAAALPEAELFLGDEATEAVLRRVGPSCRFIHIATHGLFRRDNPLFSAIRLGDSHLTLLDLYHLPLSAELVTLSGCSTGLNVVVGGGELLGLMRGLLLAGAHGVMVSLWDVKDLSTAEFMQRFYGHLSDTSHKAAALQRAVQELRQEYPHPYFWAPFLLAGRYTPAA